MPRARTKEELVKFGNDEFNKMNTYLQKIIEKNQIEKAVYDNRKAKDIVSHIHAWHLLFLKWYKVGMEGGNPAIPEEGYSFKTTPQLNEKLFNEYKDLSLDEIIKLIKGSFETVMNIIKSHSEEELFTKKKYKWTGTSSLGSYLASTTSSHYVWANGLFKKFIK